jgi:hypothetical protein
MITQKERKKWPGLSAGMVKGSIPVSGLPDSTALSFTLALVVMIFVS